MDKDHFKVSAEVLQKNAMKASIRDLNAEFQMKGGKVIYKTSKKGDTYQLSHPDNEYLEQFRLRLFKELGLIEEKDIPKELKEKQAPPPRYGDEHKLRRGWNVRSPREINEGKYNRDDRRDRRPEPQQGNRDTDGHYRGHDKPRGNYRRDDDRRGYHQDRRPRGHGSSDRYRKEPEVKQVPEEDNTRSFEERWGDISEYLEIIKKALETGSVDDGEIIKYAYNEKVDAEKIKVLKKLLWDNRCKGPRNQCPHGKKKFRFEDLMKVYSGKVEGYENIDSPLVEFMDLWKQNIDKMFDPIKDKLVDVEGKISSYKYVDRKNHEHLKVLVYDTKAVPVEGEGEFETRKLWVKVGIKEFKKLTGGETVRLEDVVSFRGKCIFDNYFNDHWIVDLEKFSIVTPSPEGEAIEIPEEN